MDQRRRTRGRPPGSSVKPYAKRTPKVIGQLDEQDDDLSPQERRRVRMFWASYEAERISLQAKARMGDPQAAATLWTRFSLVLPPIVCSFVQSYQMGMNLQTLCLG